MGGATYRSRFEAAVVSPLVARGVQLVHRPRHGKKGTGIPFRLIEEREYFPDVELPNGIYVEVKGYFDKQSRDKLLAVKRQHPHLDIRIVFQRLKDRLKGAGGKSLKTTVGDWAAEHGFPCAEGAIPDAWIQEKNKCM